MTATSAPTGVITPTQRVIGALLIIPALILWLVQLVLPTINALIMSLQDVNPIRNRDAEFVGLENYARALEQGLPAFPRTLLYAVPTILIAIVLGLLIGVLAARGSRPARMITRGILGLGLVLYAPLGVALSYEFPLGDPAMTNLALVVAVLVAVLPVAGSAAALASIAAFRSPSGGATWLAVAGLTLAVGLGLAVQIFALPYVLTRGGPNHLTETPQLLGATFGFIQFRFGPAAAITVVVGLIAAVFGLLAVLIILITRLRIEVDPPGRSERGSGIGWIGLAVAGLFLVITVAVLAPWLAGSARPWSEDFPAVILINTWLPSLVGTVIQLVVALAAGIGLGGLRPLGRFSEWGLLIFAPWLLIGDGVSMLQHFTFLRQFDLLGTFAGLLPSSMINIPAVVVFTLLFAGVRRLRESGAPAGSAIVPVIGLGLTTFVLLWLLQAQSLVSGFLNGNSPESTTGPMALVMARGQAGTNWTDLPQSLNTPLPWLIILGLASIAVQAFCMDRLRLATGQSPRSTSGVTTI